MWAAALWGALLAAAWAAPASSQESIFEPPQWELGERNDGGFYTFVTPDGEIVAQSAVIVDVGDQYIDEQNRLFEVVSVDGDRVEVQAEGHRGDARRLRRPERLGGPGAGGTGTGRHLAVDSSVPRRDRPPKA